MMIEVGHTLVSDDLGDHHFTCNLIKCKGACCVEGDLGAPLEEEELPILKAIYNNVKPYLSKEGIEAIESQGLYVFDEHDEYSTPTVRGRECAYSVYDKKGILKCGIELAYNKGKTGFRKPISCHLYPIRVTKYEGFMAVNYDRWEICNPACDLGESLKIPLYRFLKDPLIRKFGKGWYDELDSRIAEPFRGPASQQEKQ